MTEPYVPLHDLEICLRAPTVALSGRNGQIDGEGSVQGVFCADKRVLSTARLELDGHDGDLSRGYDRSGALAFSRLLRGQRDDDPAFLGWIKRVRTARANGMDERIIVKSLVQRPLEMTVRVYVGSDMADMDDVHAGRPTEEVPGNVDDAGVHWVAPGWRVDVIGKDADVDADEQALTWRLVVPPCGEAEARWSVHADDEQPLVRAPIDKPPWSRPWLYTGKAAYGLLFNRGLRDLDALRLESAELPGETFVAAGAPWFFTLFGRDSLWVARMMLPLGTDLAASTLRVHAHYQGQKYDDRSGEKPGGIIHELRRSEVTLTRGLEGTLPPRYYGTVDATPLWVMLLHDAWRWGMPAETVESLLPNLERALGWIADAADSHGFVKYIDATGQGLSNQGWKDSHDAIRFRDGRHASPPIALVEVQGYVYEATVGAADLLDAFGRPGGDRWRKYAEDLKESFRRRFWVEDEYGPYPALALDGHGRPVDALTSNSGHLLGTGILNHEEARLLTARLVAPDMNSGFGLRTMSAYADAYSPLSYHAGTVWPHDTAIVALGMAREGMASEGAQLVRGLIEATDEFENRLPELYGGAGKADVYWPVHYPEACRPQAWAAASMVAGLQVLLGLRVDLPHGVCDLSPVSPCPAWHLEVDGLVVGDKRLSVEVDRTGRVVSKSLTQAPGRSPEQRQSSPAIRLQVNDSRAAALSRGRSASVRPRPDQYRDLRRSPERMR